MAPTTLPPAERPRVTPPWPRSPSCRTRNPHNVVGDVGILSSLGLPGRRVPMLVRLANAIGLRFETGFAGAKQLD